MSVRRFVALDRDGTVIVERHYLSDPDQVELLAGAASGLRRMRDLGLGLVLVTNQSAIGRGLFDQERLARIHRRMNNLLASHDIRLDGIYYCPHTPDDDCVCRKPKTDMLRWAARDLNFDPQACFVIGDKESDIEMGKNAGATTVLVRTGYGAKLATEGKSGADHVVNDLSEAAAVIEKLLRGE
jgi:D-glycero-D-manno-heptose 1,7-bisphosphate phosphatase